MYHHHHPSGQEAEVDGYSVILLNRRFLCHNMNHYCTQRFSLYRRRLQGMKEAVIIVILKDVLVMYLTKEENNVSQVRLFESADPG